MERNGEKFRMKNRTFTRDQVLRLLKTMIVMTSVMLVFEIFFSIPGISNFFTNLIEGSSGVIAYIVIFIIMFLQTNILNVAAITIISACSKIGGLNILSLEYILIVLLAYILGACFTYFLGRKFGSKAVKWASGSDEDYNKWCAFLNKKSSKFLYFLTILFPIFPDDLLCLCAGSIKMDFGFYFIANLVGRAIGLITVILMLEGIGMATGGFPFTLAIVWAVALLGFIIAYFVIKKRKG